MSGLVALCVFIALGMLVGMTRAMLVKLLSAIRALELMTLAGNTHKTSHHQNQGGKAFHRAASYLATTETQPRSDGKNTEIKFSASAADHFFNHPATFSAALFCTPG